MLGIVICVIIKFLFFFLCDLKNCSFLCKGESCFFSINDDDDDAVFHEIYFIASSVKFAFSFCETNFYSLNRFLLNV